MTRPAVLAALLTAAVATRPAAADIVAFDDFDSSRNLTLRVSDPPLNVGTSSSRAFGIYDRVTLANETIYDQTVDNSFGAADPVDDRGIVRSDKTDSFFATDAVTGRVDWLFDISGASSLDSIELDLAAMGRFVFANKRFSYRIDGGAFQPFADLRYDPNRTQSYFMENGLSYDVQGPLVLNRGPSLTNVLTTYAFDDVAGLSGDILAIRFQTEGEFGDEAFVFDNLIVNGTTASVPEPGALSLIGLCGAAVAARRRSARRPAA